MLDVFRRASKGWVAKILMGLLVLSFGVWGIADVFSGFGRGRALASVGGQDISTEEATRVYERQLRAYSEQVGRAITPEEARRLGIDRLVLSQLLRDAALDEQASNLKLAISDKHIADDIKKNPDFQNGAGEFDAERFRDILQRSGYSEAGYIAEERTRFIRSAIAGSATDDVTPPKVLLDAIYKHRNEERGARYFIVRPSEQEVAKPTDQELKKFYDDNPKMYTAPEYRSLAVIKVEPQDIAAKIAVSDADLATFYEAHKADFFKAEARTILQMTFASVEDARKAKERIAAGTDFLVLAKERGLSETDASLGDRTWESIPDQTVANAAFALQEGQVSDPVKGSLSIVLLKVTKITPERQASLDEVRADVKKRLQTEKAHDEIESTYNAIEDARAAQESFEAIAKRAELPFLLIPAVDANGLDKDGKEVAIPLKQDVLRQAFESDVGIENDALPMPGDGYVWYDVREVIPSGVKPFDAVKAQVQADWTARKVREVAIEKVKKLAERAQNGVTLESLAAESQAEIKTIEGLKRNETSADFGPEAVAALFSIPQGSFTFAPESDGKGARVMQLQSVGLQPPDKTPGETAKIAAAVAAGSGNEFLAQYVSELETDLGVSVNQELWSKVTGANAQ